MNTVLRIQSSQRCFHLICLFIHILMYGIFNCMYNVINPLYNAKKSNGFLIHKKLENISSTTRFELLSSHRPCEKPWWKWNHSNSLFCACHWLYAIYLLLLLKVARQLTIESLKQKNIYIHTHIHAYIWTEKKTQARFK